MDKITSVSYIRRMLKQSPNGIGFSISHTKEQMFNDYLCLNNIPFLIVMRVNKHVIYYIANNIVDLIKYAYNEL